MKTIIKFQLCMAFIAMAMNVKGQDLKSSSYDAYLSNSVSVWAEVEKSAADIFESNSSIESRFELVKVQYGLLNACIANQNEDVFNEYVDEIEDHLDALIDQESYSADARALLGSIYGYKIAFSSWKGMFLGPKSSALIEQAVSENPESWIVQKMYATNQLFTPEMWGGDIDNAIQSFKLSNDLMIEQNQSDSWFYLDNHAWLGKAYYDLDLVEDARSTWNFILEKEPEYAWVSNVLLPEIENN